MGARGELGLIEPPNGLPFSGWLEGITQIEWNGLFPLLDRKMAPIQPLRWNGVLGADAVHISVIGWCSISLQREWPFTFLPEIGWS